MLLAGTSKGIFNIVDDRHTCTLAAGGIRDIVNIDDRLFAGTGQGLYTSDDEGTTWDFRGFADQAVWQIRGNGEGTTFLTYGGDSGNFAVRTAGLYRKQLNRDHRQRERGKTSQRGGPANGRREQLGQHGQRRQQRGGEQQCGRRQGKDHKAGRKPLRLNRSELYKKDLDSPENFM